MTTRATTQAWHCLICGVQISGRMQAVHHSRNYHMSANDPRRCDNVIAANTANVVTVTHTHTLDAMVTEPVLNRSMRRHVAPADLVATVQLLTRRPAQVECNYRELPASSRPVHVNTDNNPLDYTRIQQIWDRFMKPRATPVFINRATPDFIKPVTPVFVNIDTPVFGNLDTPVFKNVDTPVFVNIDTPVFENLDTPVFENLHTPVLTRYLNKVQGVASPQFWSFFLSLHTQSAVAIDAALSAAKKTFLDGDENRSANTGFVASKRTLLSRMSKIVTKFWPAVTHTIRFSLASCGLSHKKMVFRFIDPMWAWIMGARVMDPADILWEPRTQIDNNGRRLYGGGVQYGKCFATAYQSCPAGTYPMGISLHWDGTNAHGVYSVPIAIGVANTNRETANSHTCIAYMPVLTGMGREFEASKKSTTVKHYIRQKCISAILTVLEQGAQQGVRCTLLIDGL